MCISHWDHWVKDKVMLFTNEDAFVAFPYYISNYLRLVLHLWGIVVWVKHWRGRFLVLGYMSGGVEVDKLVFIKSNIDRWYYHAILKENMKESVCPRIRDLLTIWYFHKISSEWVAALQCSEVVAFSSSIVHRFPSVRRTVSQGRIINRPNEKLIWNLSKLPNGVNFLQRSLRTWRN